MSERRFTIEEKLKMTLGAFQDQYEQNNKEYWSTTEADPETYWSSLGASSAWKTAAKRIETLLAELPDTQAEHDARLMAQAEANVYKDPLMEMGAIIAGAMKDGQKDGSDRMLKILTPYVVLAMDNRPRQ